MTRSFSEAYEKAVIATGTSCKTSSLRRAVTTISSVLISAGASMEQKLELPAQKPERSERSTMLRQATLSLLGGAMRQVLFA